MYAEFQTAVARPDAINFIELGHLFGVVRKYWKPDALKKQLPSGT